MVMVIMTMMTIIDVTLARSVVFLSSRGRRGLFLLAEGILWARFVVAVFSPVVVGMLVQRCNNFLPIEERM